MILPEWILKLEQKAAWLRIPFLGYLLILAQLLGLFLIYQNPDLEIRFYLDPKAVFQGEIWRVFTFMFIPLTKDFLSIFLWWFLYYILKSLKKQWGNFKLSLYFLIGWLGVVLSSLVLGVKVDSFLLLLSTFFFAIASLNQTYEVLFFFILPIKIKWIAIFFAIVLFLQQTFFGSWLYTFHLLISCSNYFLFFGPSIFRFLKREVQSRRQGV